MNAPRTQGSLNAPISMTDAEREILAYWHSFMVGVHVPFAFVRLCGGDWQAAAMLAQLFYWFRPDREGADKTSIMVDGKRYVARRHTQWQDLELSAFEAKRAASKLASLGLLDVTHRMFDGMRTCHYRPNFSAMKAFISPTGETDSAPTGGSKFAPTDKSENAPTGEGKKPPTGGTDPAPIIRNKTTAKTTEEIKGSGAASSTPRRKSSGKRVSASATTDTSRPSDPFFDAFCLMYKLGPDGGRMAGLAGQFSAECQREGATIEQFREFCRANKREWGRFGYQPHLVTRTFLAWCIGKGYAGDPLAAIPTADGAPAYDPEDPTTWDRGRRALL